MQHKGLTYTLSAIFVLAVMMAIIAFSLSPAARVVRLESYPSGAIVSIDGEPIGKTPLLLDEVFFKRRGVDYEGAPLLRIFYPSPEGVLLSGGGSHMLLSFSLPTRAGSVPEIFETTGSAATETPQKVGAFLSFSDSDRIIVAFDYAKMPRLDFETKALADAIVFAPASDAVGLQEMGEYKSFKIAQPSSVRIAAPAKKAPAGVKAK